MMSPAVRCWASIVRLMRRLGCRQMTEKAMDAMAAASRSKSQKPQKPMMYLIWRDMLEVNYGVMIWKVVCVGCG